MSEREIFRCVYGSKLFGTNIANSDDDFRSVVIPSTKDILLGKGDQIKQEEGRQTKNKVGDRDVTKLNLQSFLRLLASSEVTAIETLFAPPLLTSHEWELIRFNRDKLICKNINRFVGFGKSQMMRYVDRGVDISAAKEVFDLLRSVRNPKDPVVRHEDIIAELNALTEKHKNLNLHYHEDHPAVPIITITGKSAQLTMPTEAVMKTVKNIIEGAGSRTLAASERGDGADLKGIYHAVRIVDEAIELLETGELNFPLRGRQLYLDIRNGSVPLQSCLELFDERVEKANLLHAQTALPDEVDKALIEELIYDFHKTKVLQDNDNDDISPSL